jgi:hypothetical protein
MGTRLWRRGSACAVLAVAVSLFGWTAVASAFDPVCSGFIPAAQDGWPGNCDYVAIDTTPDG